MWIIEMIDDALSKNTLCAVLEVVVTPSSPVVETFSCQHVDVALGLLESHPFASGEYPVLEIPDKRTAPHEARQITLAHQHHLYQNDEFLRVLL